MNEKNKAYSADELHDRSKAQGNDGEKVGKIKKDMHDIVANIGEFIESIEPKLTYDKYLEMLGDTIDKKVLAIQRQQNMTFYGGKLKLSVDRINKCVIFEAEYYFKNSEGKWINSRDRGQTRISKLDINDPAVSQFINSKEVINLTIDPPEQ